MKKQQINVLVGNHQLMLVEGFTALIEKAIGDKYDIKVMQAVYVDELLELVQNHSFDMFILVLNNIIVRNETIPAGGRIERILQIVNYLKTTYNKPIITFTGWPKDDPNFSKKAKSAGADFFFFLTADGNDVVNAIRKCLDKCKND